MTNLERRMLFRKLQRLAFYVCLAGVLCLAAGILCNVSGVSGAVGAGMMWRVLYAGKVILCSGLSLFFLYYPAGHSQMIGRGVFQLFGFLPPILLPVVLLRMDAEPFMEQLLRGNLAFAGFELMLIGNYGRLKYQELQAMINA